MTDLVVKLKEKLKDNRLEQNFDISRYVTLKNKVKAQIYVEAQSKQDIVQIVRIAHEFNVPLLFLGGGSNIAILKDVVKGIVVRNYYISKTTVEDTATHAIIRFSSGYPISRVVVETTQAGLSGFEYHLGLPGTIGGALFMNSKWTHPVSYVGDNLVQAELITRDGQIKQVERDYFHFAYDYSILQKTYEIILDAVFKLHKEDPVELKKRSQEALAYRRSTQPFGVATCGCFFRNIAAGENPDDQETSAGYYIDKAGLKNKSIGDFVVSDKHANFIINRGQGKQEDLVTLLDLIKRTVKDKFGVELKEEVIIY